MSLAIADEKYVSLVTFRRSGEGVASPVWIAPLADGRAGFNTAANSGKVKRIRNNSSVTLQVCTLRGVVTDGVAIVDATATVVTDAHTSADYRAVRDAIRSKYGFIVTLVGLGDRFRKLVGRAQTPTAIVLTFADDQAPHIARPT